MTTASGAGALNLGSIPSYPLDSDVLDLDLGSVFPEAVNGARHSKSSTAVPGAGVHAERGSAGRRLRRAQQSTECALRLAVWLCIRLFALLAQGRARSTCRWRPSSRLMSMRCPTPRQSRREWCLVSAAKWLQCQ